MTKCPYYTFEPHPPGFELGKTSMWSGTMINQEGVHKCSNPIDLLPMCWGDMERCPLYDGGKE